MAGSMSVQHIQRILKNKENEIQKLKTEIDELLEEEKRLSKSWWQITTRKGEYSKVWTEKPPRFQLQLALKEDPNATIQFGKGRFYGMCEYVATYLEDVACTKV